MQLTLRMIVHEATAARVATGIPGYSYRWFESAQQWVLFYEPSATEYSPPVFDPSIMRISVPVPAHANGAEILASSVQAMDDEEDNSSSIAYLAWRSDLRAIEIWGTIADRMRELEASLLALIARQPPPPPPAPKLPRLMPPHVRRC